MDYRFEEISEKHRIPVIDIFNYFILNTFAAFPENTVDYVMFDHFLNMMRGYPSAAIEDPSGKIVGFGFLRAFNPISTFSQTAEISYFILPDHTGKGLGCRMLKKFSFEAAEIGVENLLAGISSRNEQSLGFHLRHGFKEAGRLRKVGLKFGQYFDVVWMQLVL